MNESDSFSPVTSSEAALFASSETFHMALRMLSENTVLEELYIQGRMTKSALTVLQETIQRDFVSLSRLQIMVASEELRFAQTIVEVAKQRSYSSLKQGVSIFIDEL